MELKYVVTKKDDSKTVKDILLSVFKISHRLLITLKREKSIFVNDMPVSVCQKLRKGDNIVISFAYEEDNSNIIPTKMKLDIIYEDECYLIINKPSGISVHPSILHYQDSLSNGIRYYFDEIRLKKKIRPVNRIDKDTSGLVIFAKNEYIQECLIRQMKTNDFIKEYIAIVEGTFSEKSGTINKPIGRKENSIIERCILKDGSPSITHYEVLEENIINGLPISIVKCSLETGRTHQIRVHMACIGHPLLGDDLYGGNINFIDRQALHSYRICFYHPISNKKMIYESSLPLDINSLMM